MHGYCDFLIALKKVKNMSLRNIKKLQTPDLLNQITDDSEESEQQATPRKASNNFELVSYFIKFIRASIFHVFVIIKMTL